jgi:signal peptidase II
MWLPCGLIVGGALGNLSTVCAWATVTDFIKLPDWPAFNLADASITLGVLALVWVVSRGGAAARPA